MNKYEKSFCKEYVARRKENLKKELLEANAKPSLCIVQVGDVYASNKYVAGKIKDCEEVGIQSFLHKFDEDITEENLIEKIHHFNDLYNGIIVQLPLPKHINVHNIQNAIEKTCDVDGFRADSVFDSCTPLGILNLLNEVTDLTGKEVVILGRSEIVGKPMANLLITKSNSTVTICNSRTKDITEHTKRADIIISAMGRAKAIKVDDVKEGAIVIDVGINQDENGKLCGDVDYDNVVSKCEFITPVPGGIGLITRLTLLENTFVAYKIHNRIK